MPGMEQGPPPMQQLLAGLTGSGNPVLAGRVVRQVPA
jgi:predicted kinase